MFFFLLLQATMMEKSNRLDQGRHPNQERHFDRGCRFSNPNALDQTLDRTPSKVY